jgi:sec-independent protein translocase protein TatA
VNTMLPGGWEWIIILVVVLLVFGVGRISKIGSELGQGIRNFREGVREGLDEEKDESEKVEPIEKK